MVTDDILIAQHIREKEDSRRFKDRRTTQWNENYSLYRDDVKTNRLTQRQAVNIPIIRDTIQNWISKIDEDPILKFEARGRQTKDKQGEVIVNELWEYTHDKQSLELKDNLDKKIVGLQGRSFKFWYFQKGMVNCDVIDPYDVDIDPRVDPFNLESAQFINIKNIMVPLRRVLANKTYNADAKRLLKIYLDSKVGLLKSHTIDEEYERKRERLTTLGADNYDEYRATDVLVELNRSHKLIWHADKGEFVRHLLVIAMDNVVLYNKPCKEAYGVDYTPLTTWASDPDLNDIWPDGTADNVRTINKVVNMYFSQDLENRAYRNFGMYFYDTNNGAFKPQAFEPRPFGMYPVAGRPSEVLQQVRIEPLEDTMPTIGFLQELIQSSVAQTPTERGVQQDAQTTLGEVQLSLQQSQSRQQVVAKQYRKAWEESGNIWYDLMNANSQGVVKLHKRAPNGEMYEKDVTPSDWKTPRGYEVSVQLKSEREADDDIEFKKNQFVKQSFINNPIAQKIAKRKELEIIGWSPDEVDEVMQFEEQQLGQPQLPAGPEGVDAGAAQAAEAAPEGTPSPQQV